ncbi:hypothetical protein ACFV80_43320 [Streptomyces sp. NPDC059862]|uniref:hypothetical protein n=1 Tax=Streptomyces sp. NPDC059862 TaxID=3346975 RepID=UPI003661A430
MTSRHGTAGSTHRARLAMVTLGLAVAAVTTACGEGADEDAQTRSDTKPSIRPTGAMTAQQAAKILGEYEEVNNQANASMDADAARLLGTVEAGDVARPAQARFTAAHPPCL